MGSLIELVHMKNKEINLVHVKTESVRRRGGSLEITLPSQIAEFLDVGEGNKIALFKDEKHKLVIIINAKRANVVIPGFAESRLGFSISKELAEKLLAKER